MITSTKLYWWTLSFFLVGYLAFIPFGPYPIQFLGTKLDILFAAALLVTLSPGIIVAVRIHDSKLSILLTLYLMAAFLSVPTSSNPLLSTREWFVTVGYAMVAYIGSALLYPFAERIRLIFLGSGFLASIAVVIIRSTNNSPKRFAFGPEFGVPIIEGLRYVDPNFTGIGLLMCIIVSLPLLSWRGNFGLLRTMPMLLVQLAMLAAMAITLSRTALVAAVGGLAIATSVLAFRSIMTRRRYQDFLNSAVIWLFGVMGVAVLAGIMLTRDLRLMDRLLNSFEDSARIQLLHEALVSYTGTPKNIILGEGYMVLNPHNEYLNNLVSSGPLAFMLFLLLLYIIFGDALRHDSGSYLRNLSCFWLCLAIFIAIAVYPLVKLFWVAVLAILIFSQYERHKTIHDASSKSGEQGVKNVNFD